MIFKNFILVAAGGGIGAVLRYYIYLLSKPQLFPYSTLMINIAGSFLLGIMMALNIKNEANSESMKLFIGTGICGGFTTFSTFSFENFALLQQGKINLAFIYIITSVVAGITATWIGYKIINH